ncbi:MAG TPA: biopolymer transporter ExbD [Sphingomonas sp.]|uniref:ExbD/TolR family protein n=1 Tax=Sphingomonas sp. TaxID=28214 RepID=UPI002C6AE8E4|nr:biopolymer transporter ExbD [Sphingomonas sp.]HMI21250.1 biopolymer transporter ExbD [Sphingomonas sp.]
MAMSSSVIADQPMMDINTTPLIDVMLVLLIMFIITIPMQTHAVKVDTPSGPPPRPAPPPIRNEVAITNTGQVLWNSTPVDLVTLRRYLDQSQTLDPIPELQLRPASDARYETVDSVLAVTKHAHVTRMGFVGNEAYANDF